VTRPALAGTVQAFFDHHTGKEALADHQVMHDQTLRSSGNRARLGKPLFQIETIHFVRAVSTLHTTHR